MTSRMNSRMTATAVVAVLSLAGCSADDAEVVDVEQPEDGAEQTPEAVEPEGAGATVIVEEFAFQTGSMIVQPDTVVTWENQDSTDHTVTSGTPNEPTGVFDGELPANGELTISVDEAGTYPYYCRIHPNMTADLIVEPSAV